MDIDKLTVTITLTRANGTVINQIHAPATEEIRWESASPIEHIAANGKWYNGFTYVPFVEEIKNS